MTNRPPAASSLARLGATLGLVVAAGLIVMRPLPAAAQRELSRAEFVELAETRPVPVAELGAVTSVDGQPIDTTALLQGTPADIEARFEALSALVASQGPAGPTTTSVDAGQARDDAKDILAERRFQRTKIPRPFVGALRWLGDQLAKVGRPFKPIFANKVAAVTFTVFSIGLAAWLFVGLARRRQRHARREPARAVPGIAGFEPDHLDAEAAAAARDGDLDRALRLRFLAGLLRLDRNGKLDYSPTATTDTLSRTLDSPVFDTLAGRHDEVAYGTRPATEGDLDEAVAGWAQLTGRKR